MSTTDLIYLHVGCEWSEPWDKSLESAIQARGLRVRRCDLATVCMDEPGAFMGRFSERGRDYRTNYAAQVRPFLWCWPEVSAFEMYDDKCLQAEWLAKHQYPQPAFEVVRQGPAAWTQYPVVWKRPDGSAGKRVRLIQSAAEVVPPCLLQEFCPDNPGDYRITVIGDQVSAIGRHNRPGDFRASGSGRSFLAVPDLELALLCWQICRRAGWGTMGFDVLQQNGQWVITEMSYTYPIYSITDWTQQCWQFPQQQLISRQEHPVDTLLDWLLRLEPQQSDQTRGGLGDPV